MHVYCLCNLLLIYVLHSLYEINDILTYLKNNNNINTVYCIVHMAHGKNLVKDAIFIKKLLHEAQPPFTNVADIDPIIVHI